MDSDQDLIIKQEFKPKNTHTQVVKNLLVQKETTCTDCKQLQSICKEQQKAMDQLKKDRETE